MRTMKTMTKTRGLAVAASILVGGLGLPAHASERRFAYTYQSLVLNAGEVELEPWTTYRYGRQDFYSRFDQRVEFEVGVTDRLQMAWYLNFKAVTADVGPQRQSTFDFGGVSWELKYKLLDPVADPVGLALYFEPGLGPDEAELEAKVIVDKRLGSVIGAINVVGEIEWEYGGEETEREVVLEFDVGVAYLLTRALSAGLELRVHNEFPEGKGLEHSALFAGPALSYAGDKWWTTVTVLPQLASLTGGDDGSVLSLRGHERFEARVLFGFHL